MCKLKIACDDCVTWYVSEGVWVCDPSEASILSYAEARQILETLNDTALAFAVVVVL